MQVRRRDGPIRASTSYAARGDTPTEIESEVSRHIAMCHPREGRYRKSPSISVAVHSAEVSRA